LGKHTLKIEYDYGFVMIGISSHEKDYRICWALNKVLGLSLTKNESLEIKSKKQDTPSFFSLFSYENKEEFVEYSVIANLSENKTLTLKDHSLFSKGGKESQSTENGILIPEHKQLNYFFVIRGEMDNIDVEETIKRIKEIDIVLTAVNIDVNELKSKKNLIF
jgi:hypothetical protein